MSREKTDFIANAREGWGDALPDWVLVLAQEANRTSASDVARRLNRSPSLVSTIIKGVYGGDIGKIETLARGAFMGAVVLCPVLGEMKSDRCLAEQDKTHAHTSAVRADLYRACRGGCRHSKLKEF